MPGWVPAAGTRLCLLYLPFMARCSPRNKICGEAELGEGWEMSRGVTWQFLPGLLLSSSPRPWEHSGLRLVQMHQMQN